jgi:hypothetical protein
VVNVAIHPSVFPDRLRAAVVASLRTRCINPRLHYEGARQMLRWQALHAQCSPAVREQVFQEVYQPCFDHLARELAGRRLEVIGLGCGSGWKEARLLQSLHAGHARLAYWPVDASLALLIEAHRAAWAAAPACAGHPVAADLAEVDDLKDLIGPRSPEVQGRILTCFGVLPSLAPEVIVPRLARWVSSGDWLVASANLAPGDDYLGGTRAVLPQYDNAPTRAWLLGSLAELGFEPHDGSLSYSVETAAEAFGLLRIVADFELHRPRGIELEHETFEFEAGARMRSFFSYRFTPDRVRALLGVFGLETIAAWRSGNGEEGVFLARRPG